MQCSIGNLGEMLDTPNWYLFNRYFKYDYHASKMNFRDFSDNFCLFHTVTDIFSDTLSDHVKTKPCLLKLYVGKQTI